MEFKTVFLYNILSRDGFKQSKLLKIIFTDIIMYIIIMLLI